VVHLGLPSDTTASQSWILVAVPPTVDRPLNQTALASQTRVQFRQSPTNLIAIGFVSKSVSLVLLLRDTSSGIDTVLGFELLRQGIGIDRFNITTNGVFHFDAVPGIFESDPLNAVSVLSNH
jgi:hypothetical protein